MGLVTRQYTYIPGRTIRSAEVNKNENTLYEVINGNLEDINLLDSTLTQRVLHEDVNPLVRDAEKYVSFVSSGLEVVDATAAGILKVAVASGIAYTVYGNKMYRTNTTAETYTLSNTDNGTYYLYIDHQGTFSDSDSPDPEDGRQAVAQLTVSGQPSSPGISVMDMRRMKLYDLPSHTITGCTMAVAGVTSCAVTAGQVEIGSLLLTATGTSPALDITNSSNYFEGSIAATQSWCYVYVTRLGTSLTWQAKLSASPPQYADTQGNTAGVLRYRAVGDNWYRCVGAVYRKSDGQMLPFYQNGDYVQYGTFLPVAQGSLATANIPAVSTLGYFHLYARTTAGEPGHVAIHPSGSSGDPVQMTPYGINDELWMCVQCATNASQQISCTLEYYATCSTMGYWLNIR